MKKWILSLTIFAFLAVSCKKKVTITGRVYNPVTNEGISGVNVTLSKQKMGVPGSVDGSGANILASTVTDANGNYSFIEKLNKNKSYGIGFAKDDNLYYQIEGEHKNVDAGESNLIINWPLVPAAYIKFHIKNTNCFDASDDIFITLLDDFDEYSINNGWGYSGCAEYTSDDFGRIISGNLYFHWKVTKNSIVTHFYDTITLAPFEQRYYEILY